MATSADRVPSVRRGLGVITLVGLALTMSACGSDETAEFDSGDPQAEEAATSEAPAGEASESVTPDEGAEDETGAEDGPDAEADGVPGVDFPDPDDAIAEDVFTAPDTEDTQVRVGIESIIVTERTMELRLLLTPEGSDEMTARDVLGRQSGATLIDRQNLKEYGAIDYRGQYYGTDSGAQVLPGQTIGFQRFYAAPEDDITEIDVVLDPSWPPFEDVPLTVED